MGHLDINAENPIDYYEQLFYNENKGQMV